MLQRKVNRRVPVFVPAMGEKDEVVELQQVPNVGYFDRGNSDEFVHLRDEPHYRPAALS